MQLVSLEQLELHFREQVYKHGWRPDKYIPSLRYVSRPVRPSIGVQDASAWMVFDEFNSALVCYPRFESRGENVLATNILMLKLSHSIEVLNVKIEKWVSAVDHALKHAFSVRMAQHKLEEVIYKLFPSEGNPEVTHAWQGTKAEALELIWKHTHRDFKGESLGYRSILVNDPPYGTCCMPLECLSDELIVDRLASAVRLEHRQQSCDTQTS